MQIVAPEILEEARQLPPYISGAGLLVGLLLWSLGGRTHRFWLAMSVTLAAGMLGLTHGRQYGMQPLVAGLLLAVSAGALALSLVRLLLFAAGGLAALALLRAVAPGWDEPIAVFLIGGLFGVLLYRFWIITLASLIGSLMMTYSTLALLDRLRILKDSIEWSNRNGPLLNWGFASLVVTGAVAQLILARRRSRPREPVELPAPPPPAPVKPARLSLWEWGEKLLQRRAG
jgi:hypothetical protein